MSSIRTKKKPKFFMAETYSFSICKKINMKAITFQSEMHKDFFMKKRGLETAAK